jgi:hypothetical protein
VKAELRVGPSDSDRALARGLVEAFVEWLDDFGEASFDPYDFWSSGAGRRARRLYYRRPALGSLTAAPFVALDTLWPSSRKLISRPQRYPIADAHYAAGFFHWAASSSGSPKAVERGRHFLEELMRSRSRGFEELCWGYPFDWESRSGTIEAGTPLITTVPYVYEAFETGYEVAGEGSYLSVMESIAGFAFERIPVTELPDGSAAAGYTPTLRTRVVNASCYRAFLLASAGRRFGRPEWAGEADRNIAFVLATQRQDGSWPYAPTTGDEFVDNFHTCLVLKNLLKFWRVSGGDEVLDAVRRGYAFYRRELLDGDLRPVPFAVKPRVTFHRGDLYDYAEGILLAGLLQDVEPTARAVLPQLLHGLSTDWTLPDGHFVTRRFAVGRNTVPYHRWAQSQTFHALVQLCRDSG